MRVGGSAAALVFFDDGFGFGPTRCGTFVWIPRVFEVESECRLRVRLIVPGRATLLAGIKGDGRWSCYLWEA